MLEVQVCHQVVKSQFSSEKTFWEKVTLIRVECNRGKLRANAEQLSRHWYNLVALAKHPAGQSAIENKRIFRIILIYYKNVIAQLATTHLITR
jgi:hypothetical protein